MTARSLLPPEVAVYIETLCPEPDPGMTLARELGASTNHIWTISRSQGQYLELLVRSIAAVRVLEVGTFCGYSALWLARGLSPGGRVRSIDHDEAMLTRAARSLSVSPVGDRIHLEFGQALDVLAAAPPSSEDLVFLDGEKIEYPKYFAHAVRICRVGGMVIADNTLYRGKVVPACIDGDQARAIAMYNELAFTSDGVLSALIPLGDGYTVSLRTA